MVFKFFDKKTGSGASVNEELVQELQKPVIKKLKKTVHAGFKNNIWAADLAKMGSLSSKNWGVKYLFCVIGAFTKYAWVKHWEIKKLKQSFVVLLKSWTNLITNLIYYGLIKEDKFIIALAKIIRQW